MGSPVRWISASQESVVVSCFGFEVCYQERLTNLKPKIATLPDRSNKVMSCHCSCRELWPSRCTLLQAG
jgi:hypothetical protein